MLDNFVKFKVRNRSKSKWKNNNNFRSLFESIIPFEVVSTLNDWKNNYNDDNYVLIGGYALKYYLKPRYTEDIDLIFLSFDEIPEKVNKFRRNRSHSFEHIKYGVEIELLTPEYINVDKTVFEEIFKNSKMSDGINIASPESLIALKLYRFNESDKNDIINLYKYCVENQIEIDLTPYGISDDRLEEFEKLVSNLNENISENLYMLNNKLNLKGKYKKYNFKDCEVYVMQEKWGEPRFHLTKNILKNVKKFTDFQFAISLTKPFENNKLRVLDSSTGYNNLDNFKDLENEFKVWLNKNLNNLKKDWNLLNERKINEKI